MPAALCYGLGLVSPALAAEPVTITVQGDARPPGELPNEPFVATSRVKRERLEGPGLRAPEVLRSEAGVQISEAGGLGAPASASIRGATAAQTPVYLAGVRLNDQVGGVADLSTIPLWLIDHVDVYRGNAPLEADLLGIGGAIFFEPKQPRRAEAAAGATLGSFGTRAGFGYVAGGTEALRLLGGVTAERADNDYPFVDDRGTLFQGGDDVRSRRSNSDSRLVDAWLLGRARLSQQVRLEFLANSVAREQGAPKLALVPSELARAELSRSLGALTARLALGPRGQQRLTLRTAFVQSASELHDPARELGLLASQTRVDGLRSEQHAQFASPLVEGLEMTGLLATAFEDLERHDGSERLRAVAVNLRAASSLEWQAASGLWLRGLLAFECRSAGQAGARCGAVEPVGRVGLGIQGSGATIYANLARYQRQPTLGELFGAGILVRGNDQLRPELGLAADVGVRATRAFGPRLSLNGEASAFTRSVEQLVAYARTAQGYVVPLNIGAARVSGLELGAGAELLGHVTASCNVSLLDARDTTEGRRLRNDILPFSSRLVASPRVSVTTGRLARGSLQRAEAALDMIYLSNRFADAAGLIAIPEQATLGVSAGVHWLAGALVTRARLANALNAARFDVVGYPLPGRSLYVSAEAHWDGTPQ